MKHKKHKDSTEHTSVLEQMLSMYQSQSGILSPDHVTSGITAFLSQPVSDLLNKLPDGLPASKRLMELFRINQDLEEHDSGQKIPLPEHLKHIDPDDLLEHVPNDILVSDWILLVYRVVYESTTNRRLPKIAKYCRPVLDILLHQKETQQKPAIVNYPLSKANGLPASLTS